MKKYSWSLDRDAERWGNDTFDTVEECITDAKQIIAEADYLSEDVPIVVFIGENVFFAPRVDIESMLDIIQDQASDFAGEVGGEWDAYDHKKRDELDELEETLTTAVLEWMQKYGYEPDFYSVEDIEEYALELGEGARDSG